MSKMDYFLLTGLVLLPFISCRSQPHQKYYKNNEYRRVGLTRHDKKVNEKFFDALYNTDDFFDSLYNVKGKKHDMGADFLLTTPLYKHINPFYTKKVHNNDKESSPAFYPVYNHQNNTHNSDQDMIRTNEQNNSGYQTYQSPPTAIQDEKSNSFIPPSTSYGVPDTSHSSYGPPTNYGPLNTYPTYESPSTYPSSPSFPSTLSGSGYSYTPSNPINYGPSTMTFPTAPGSSSYYPGSHMPPPPLPQYGPPTAVMETVQKGHEGFIEKLIKKIDLVLMSKALLKLIIFKKIIKFIAVICLLMFIPVLKKKFEESTGGSGNVDEERKSKLLDSYSNVDFRIKEVANFALTAIEAFESHDIRWCVGESEFYCRLQYMLDAVDSRYPGNRMLTLWFPQLVTTTELPNTYSPTTPAYPKK